MAIVTTDDKHYKSIADQIRRFSTQLADMGGIKPEGLASGIGSVYKSGITRGKTDGKIELLKASKYMNGTASGTVVVCDSVSPDFDMAVQLASDTVTDFSAVNVSRYGKNLFKLQDFTFTTASGEYEVKDGIFTARYTQTVATSTPIGSSRLVPNYVGLPVYPSGTYTFFAEFSYNPYGGGEYPYLEIKLADGTVGKLEVDKPTEVAQAFTPNAIKFASSVSKNAGDVYTTRFQLVWGGVSDYEPYVQPTIHTATADGAVQGVKSLSPSMTLVSDTDGVTLDCSYLRDIDTYIDSLIGGV